MKKVRVYLSASRDDIMKVREYAAQLDSLGVEITDRWFETDMPPDRNTPKETAADIARSELKAIRSSDVFAFIAPTQGKGRGCHVELGYALAARAYPLESRLSVWVVTDPNVHESIFETLADRFMPTMDLIPRLAEMHVNRMLEAHEEMHAEMQGRFTKLQLDALIKGVQPDELPYEPFAGGPLPGNPPNARKRTRDDAFNAFYDQVAKGARQAYIPPLQQIAYDAQERRQKEFETIVQEESGRIAAIAVPHKYGAGPMRRDDQQTRALLAAEVLRANERLHNAGFANKITLRIEDNIGMVHLNVDSLVARSLW